MEWQRDLQGRWKDFAPQSISRCGLLRSCPGGGGIKHISQLVVSSPVPNDFTPLLHTAMPSRFSFAPILLLGAVTALAIAYAYTVFTRPIVPDWKREEDRAHYGLELC